MATAPKGNNMGYDPESTMLKVNNNMKKALMNSYDAAYRKYLKTRTNALNRKMKGELKNEMTAEVKAASKLVKNTINTIEMRGIPLTNNMKKQKLIHNRMSGMTGGKTRKASRRRLTRRRR